jgi:hypothetical protein
MVGFLLGLGRGVVAADVRRDREASAGFEAPAVGVAELAAADGHDPVEFGALVPVLGGLAGVAAGPAGTRVALDGGVLRAPVGGSFG